jgi:hypothetical protein
MGAVVSADSYAEAEPGDKGGGAGAEAGRSHAAGVRGAAEEQFSCAGALVSVFPLAWEFLKAVSGAERLGWPPAWGKGSRKSGQAKKRSGAVAQESSQGSAYRGEPSLAVFRGVVC